MVYGFPIHMEPLGTSGYMPFVTFEAVRDEIRGKHRARGLYLAAASTKTRAIQWLLKLKTNRQGLIRAGKASQPFNTMDTSAMHLRLATPADIPAIIALERTPMAREFVGQWSEDRHCATLTGGDARYYVSEAEWGEVQAYAILRGINEDSRAIELKRIVVAVPERGLGRSMLKELMCIAFHELGAHRFFLDVYDDNARARHLYESLGFQYEGVLRDAAHREGQWCNLRLMSILESEYR